MCGTVFTKNTTWSLPTTGRRLRYECSGESGQRHAETFSGLLFGLMLGIGSGIPTLPTDLDIRLGDVVISQPNKTFGGVV